MRKADYMYAIDRKKALIEIIDMNLGNVSVTNGIEDVTAQIGKYENVYINDFAIVYRDSDDRWDGWDPVTESFYPLEENYEKKLIYHRSI